MQFLAIGRRLAACAMVCLAGALALAGEASAQLEQVVRNVKPGGVVALGSFTLISSEDCSGYSFDLSDSSRPRLGRLVSQRHFRDTAMCSGRPSTIVAYIAGRQRGTDRFRLVMIGEGEVVEYDVIVNIR